MILHARFEGVHSALIHSHCTITYARWEACPNVSLHHHHLLHRTLSLPLLSQIFLSVQIRPCRKQYLPCVVHEIFFPSSIYSPPTDSDRVSYARSTPALNMSKVDFRLHIAQCFCHISLYGSSSILDALELALDGASDLQHFLPWTCRTRSSKLMKTATPVFEVWWRWRTGLQFL
jgi:hypothetical protein